jgi:prepilin-type N-terminal cleavage/methylation domain-containing protein
MKQPFPTTHNRHEHGFTVIELMVVIVILLILGALVALTYSGVQAKNRNAARQNAINQIQAQLEAYYAQTNKYPTLSSLNDASWRKSNTEKLSADILRDPRWSDSVTACTANSTAVAAAKPVANCYSYQVTASDGSACDNAKADCGHYTLTANLEGGEKYVKSSLN